ncbi:hypothetical protein [Saccharibacillus endophyticus]|uniref:RNA polymerase sigma-70 region 4 domain-containing protein n=1 Tax=Saccharibacillus endophyticus TaxID=2060666 RepID=A0ABQ1ZW58_9BACL|nr:hypothetical protein [Saccharibacillus endophyticus]GGH79059.1 hypothetical protein GCM10007362_25280 [Saccharibacillus endophyticus]
MAWIEVGSKQRLRDIMEAELFPIEAPELPSGDPREEKEAAELRRLLASNEIECRYLYAQLEYGKLRRRELPYPGLPKDERGLLPAMIQIIPPSRYLEREALERSVLFFCEKFLDIRAQKVVHLRFLSVEEAIGSYVDFTSDMFGKPEFSDERIREIAEKSDKSENGIRELVTRALRKKAAE